MSTSSEEQKIATIGRFRSREKYLETLDLYNRTDGVFHAMGLLPYIPRTCPQCLQVFKTQEMMKLHEPSCLLTLRNYNQN